MKQVTLPENITTEDLIQLDNGRFGAVVTGHTATHAKLTGNGYSFELLHNDHVNAKTPIGSALTFRADLVLEVSETVPVAKPAVAPKGQSSGSAHVTRNPMN